MAPGRFRNKPTTKQQRYRNDGLCRAGQSAIEQCLKRWLKDANTRKKSAMFYTIVAENSVLTSGYATMVHGRGCSPHRCTTAFANVEITSL